MLTPEETNDITRLISALESNRYAKGVGYFKSEVYDFVPGSEIVDAFCCLGVYCEINGLQYRPSQGDFYFEPVQQGNTATLPAGHWLGTVVDRCYTNYEGRDDSDHVPLQSVLTQVNDASETFEPVVSILRDFLNGKRDFSDVTE